MIEVVSKEEKKIIKEKIAVYKEIEAGLRWDKNITDPKEKLLAVSSIFKEVCRDVEKLKNVKKAEALIKDMSGLFKGIV